ncbi:MAG: hypothetical protein R6U98_09870, partial [Pirellulaceae bacterium]
AAMSVAASVSNVSESVSLSPASTASATSSDTMATATPVTTVTDDSDSEVAAGSSSSDTVELVIGPVRSAPPVPGAPAALGEPVEPQDTVDIQAAAPETANEAADPWERAPVSSQAQVTERSLEGVGESLVLEDEPVERYGQSSRAVGASGDDSMVPGSRVSDVAIFYALPVTSVSDADRRSLALDRGERFAGEPMADSLAGTFGVDELLSRVERPIPGLYEPSARSAAIDSISRDLQSGRRLDTPLSAVSIDELSDGELSVVLNAELSDSLEDEDDDAERWTEAVDAVLELGTMF